MRYSYEYYCGSQIGDSEVLFGLGSRRKKYTNNTGFLKGRYMILRQLTQLLLLAIGNIICNIGHSSAPAAFLSLLQILATALKTNFQYIANGVVHFLKLECCSIRIGAQYPLRCWNLHTCIS